MEFHHVALALPVVLIGLSLVWTRRLQAVVTERFQAAARMHRGQVFPGAWCFFPRLAVGTPDTQAEIQVSCMQGGRGRSPKTFAWIGCDAYPELTFNLRRMPARAGMLERFGWRPLETGDAAFDAGFWIDKAAPPQSAELFTELFAEFFAELFDGDLRAAMLAVDPGLRLRVSLGRTMTYRDGRMLVTEEQPRLEVSVRRLPPREDDVLALLAIASHAHGRVLGTPLAKSA